jgi:chitin disaccharide deacetylase
MKRLIVNADDFGYTQGVNAGVIRGFREGIITSTTIMANGAAFEDAVQHAKQNPKLGVGCHLVLVDGPCVAAPTSIPSLANQHGQLPPTLALLMRKLLTGAIKEDDIARELRAQIRRIIQAGIEPTHVDSHKHTHSHPRVLKQLVRVANEFGIRRIRKPFEDANVLLKSAFAGGWQTLKRSMMALAARRGLGRFDALARANGVVTPDHFWGVAATGRLNNGVLLSTVASIPEGASELMCHPGEYDERLESSNTSLKHERQNELEALVDPVVRVAIKERGIELIDYRGLN